MARKKKKNQYAVMLTVFIMAVVAVVVGMIAYNAGQEQGYFSVDGTGSGSGGDNGGDTVVVASNWCQDNPSKTLKVRIKDGLSTSGAYINGSTVYIVDEENGATEEATINGGTTGSFTSVKTDMVCGRNTGYKVYMKANGDYNSGDYFKITPAMLNEEKNTVSVTFDGTEYTPMKLKLRDLDANADAYDSSNSTDFQTSLTSTFYGSTGSTAWTVGADGFLELEFTLQPNSSSEAKGEAMYVALNIADDSNINDWDKDAVIAKWNGQTLAQASGLSTNEIQALSSYELIYKVDNPVGMSKSDSVVGDGEMTIGKKTQDKLYLYLVSGDGINPDFDPVVKFVALGDFKSTKTDEVLSNVGFKDDSSFTELYSAQTATLSVS